MNEPLPIYTISKKTAVSPLPAWAMKLAYRLLQLSHKPGEYRFTLIVTEDGRKRLRVEMVTVEELGK